MIYKVKAKIIERTIGEFYRKLADGKVAQQRPDGEEITASMACGIFTNLAALIQRAVASAMRCNPIALRSPDKIKTGTATRR